MSKFQVGDRVEFTEEYQGCSVGTQGTVTKVVPEDEEAELVSVDMDNGKTPSAFAYRLKHIEATQVPKEFRFFDRASSSISILPYTTFEAALTGWKGYAQDGQEVEIIEIVSHGTYKATLKIEEA